MSFTISDADISDVIAFLESLINENFITPSPRFSNPWTTAP